MPSFEPNDLGVAALVMHESAARIEALAERLEVAGCTVSAIVLVGRDEGTVVAQTMAADPRLVFLQCDTPSSRGATLAPVLRRRALSRHCVLVGWTNEQGIRPTGEMPFDAWLTEPLDVELIRDLVERSTVTHDDRLRVLAVHDEPDPWVVLRAAAAPRGGEVFVARDLASALHAQIFFKPHVAFVHLALASSDPFEVGRRLGRGARAGSSPPMIAALARSDMPDLRRRAALAGFGAYLIEPLDFETISLFLGALAKRRRRPDASVLR